MKINKTAAVQVKSQDAQVAAMLSEQYGVCEKAKDSLLRESMKFGALLIDAEQLIGECKGGYGSAGEGIKAWLAEHCPEINYKTAMGYKATGAMAANMLGGGRIAIAALLDQSTIAKTTGEVIDVPSEVIEKRDELFANIDSRRKLQQAYFAFMAENGGGKAKRKQPKGLAKSKLNGGGEEALPPEDQALVTWDEPMKLFMTKRGVFYSAAKLLPVNAAENFIEELESLVKVLKKRVEEA